MAVANLFLRAMNGIGGRPGLCDRDLAALGGRREDELTRDRATADLLGARADALAGRRRCCSCHVTYVLFCGRIRNP